jgi:hypothetical protein
MRNLSVVILETPFLMDIIFSNLPIDYANELNEYHARKGATILAAPTQNHAINIPSRSRKTTGR